MKKNVPLYDIILIGILIVLAAYYLFVQGPIKQRTEELEAEKISIENEIFALEPKIKQKHVWEEELKKIYAKYDNNPISIPDYDNIDNIINEMHLFLDDCGFSVNHGSVSLDDNIVTRNISITFTTGSYETMKAKVEAIHNSTYKYQITDLSVSNNGYSCTCKLNLVAYEYDTDGKL